MIQLDLIDYAEAAARRDAGMEIAQANNPDWYGCALAQVEQFLAQRAIGETFTFEDIVIALTPLIGAPPSKAIPGSVCMRAIKLKLIEKTGEYRAAKGVLKNAHENKVYRWRCCDA